MPTISSESVALRLQFFDYIFGNEVGQVCIAIGNSDKTFFKQQWFKWPLERERMGMFIAERAPKYNVWFGITLFNRPERKRAYAIPGTRVWADLDEVDPDTIEPLPQVIIESSPGRYQAIWSFSEPIPPDVAQDYSKRIAYSTGADKSGWDLEQLLRVPYTLNFKYADPSDVKLLRILGALQSSEFFDSLPVVTDVPATADANGQVVIDDAPELPDIDTLPTLGDIMLKYERKLNDPTTSVGNVFNDLVSIEPHESEDWSARLWRLIMVSFEIGMNEEEALAVALVAKCNKYARDNRPVGHLWRDVKKASIKNKQFNINTGIITLDVPVLIDPDTVTEDSFVADYKSWANEATDAPEQYHELSCFIGLSSVISQGLALQLQYHDNFRPNLWGLLLGESTLSRKTTAMRMAMDLITDLDSELILASDGSAEGLLSGLSERPKRVSIFYKDEVSGFFDSINRKDYLAGFTETLTQLYDVPKVYPRKLRKETITVVEPYFIFFGGGIRDKVYNLISDDYIISGFIPRFLVVSSENDMSRIRRTGPPTSISSNKKDTLINRLADLKERYSIQVPIKIGTQVDYIDGRVDAWMKDEAWKFLGDTEENLQRIAVKSYWSELALPTFTRMAFNMLKMAMLIAASRKPASDANKLEIELSDLHQAAYYIQKWSKWSVELIMSSGRSSNEKTLDRAMLFIRSRTDGVTQSEFMQRFHMSSREMKDVRDTLSDRGLITWEKRGRGLVLKASVY